MYKKNTLKKEFRILSIYDQFMSGEILKKKNLAENYNVNEKTIQRDIQDIRDYLSVNPDIHRTLIYNRKESGYQLISADKEELTNSQIFAVCKILLESRSMVKEEMLPIIDKLIARCVPTQEYRKVAALIGNEKHHYLEPHHGKKFIEMMWDIGNAVYQRKRLQVTYQKLSSPEPVTRLLEPVGIMFSEFYFYLTAYICKNEEIHDVPKRDFPTVYRIDRILNYEILNENFFVPYKERFEEGEFRKRIQFMTGGELRIIRFWCREKSLEAILDRFPTAEIIKQEEERYLIRAEVYGDGVNMWLRAQGEWIEVLDN